MKSPLCRQATAFGYGTAGATLAALVGGFAFAGFDPAKLGAIDIVNLQRGVVVCSALILIALAAFRLRTQRVSTFSRPEAAAALLLAAFYGLATISAVWSERTGISLMVAGAFAFTSLGAIALATIARPGRVLGGLAIGLWCMIGLSALLHAGGLFDAWDRWGRVSGPYPNENVLGYATVVLAFLHAGWALVRSPSSLYRGLQGSLAAAAVLLCYYTTSRGALLGAILAIVVAILLWSLLRFPGHRSMIGVATASAILGTVILAFVTGIDIEGTTLHVFGYRISIGARLHMWETGWTAVLDRPLFGYGIDGFWTDERKASYIARGGEFYPELHNGFATVLTQTGFVGLTLFIGAVASCIALAIRRLLRFGDQDNLLALMYILAFLTLNLYSSSILRATMGVQFFLTYSLAAIVVCNGRQKSLNTDTGNRGTPAAQAPF